MFAKLLAQPPVQKLVEKAKAKPLYAAGIILGVIGLIIFALVNQSDRHDQLIAGDVGNVSDLAEIQAKTQKYFVDHDKLPESLPELEGDEHPNPNFVRDDYMFDSQTKRLHDYKVLTLRSYELCADFHFSYEKEKGVVPLGVDENSIWRHGAGHQCFKFFVTRDPKSK